MPLAFPLVDQIEVVHHKVVGHILVLMVLEVDKVVVHKLGQLHILAGHMEEADYILVGYKEEDYMVEEDCYRLGVHMEAVDCMVVGDILVEALLDIHHMEGLVEHCYNLDYMDLDMLFDLLMKGTFFKL